MAAYRCYLLGERAAVLELPPPATLDQQRRIWQLASQLDAEDAVREVVPGMNNLTVILHSPVRDERAVLDWIEHRWSQTVASNTHHRVVEIPVIYGGEAGPDLDEVARHCGLTPEQVVQQHSQTDYVVFFLGFQPGFPYLGGLPPHLATPRRAEPRLRVPAGSIGIGGSQTGIYPQATPGGWQLIGRALLPLFDRHRQPPALLQPGDTVRFVPHTEGLCPHSPC